MKASAVWIVGLSGLVVLTAAGLYCALPIMESDLKLSVNQALVTNGLTDVQADVSGDTVSLSVPAGTVAAPSRLKAARSVVASLKYSDPLPPQIAAPMSRVAWLNAPVSTIRVMDTPTADPAIASAPILPDNHHSALPDVPAAAPQEIVTGEKATAVASMDNMPRVAGDSAQDASVVVAQTCEAQVDQAVGKRKISYLPGTYDLTPDSQDLMDDVYKAVANCPAKVRVTVAGYSDNVGDGTVNQLISLSRAQAAADALVDRGLSPDRVAVRGYGATAPVSDNSTPEGREKNRRVVFGINAG